MEPIIRWLYLILFGLGSVACWGFVFRYTRSFRWYSTLIGRHLIAISSICGLIYTWNFVVILLPMWQDNPVRYLVSVALFALFTVVLWWRWYIFEKIAREVKRDKAQTMEDE